MGKLIIFSAPSGSGKTTIVKELMKKMPNLAFSISATTRAKRGNEMDKKDYYFLSLSDFKSKIKKNMFAEWEEVYENKFYGTLKQEIERLWSEGKHVVFDVDVKGGLNLKKMYSEKALAIFIQAPSVVELKKRLLARATDSKEEIESRVNKAAYEMTFAQEFDFVVVNAQLEEAVSTTFDLVNDFINN